MTFSYAAAMTLIIAAHLGPYGIAVWAAAWCVITYRATSNPRPYRGEAHDRRGR